MAERIVESILKSEIKDDGDFISWFLQIFTDYKEECTIEEFAVFFLNFLRYQTDEFLRGNLSSPACNTPETTTLNDQNDCNSRDYDRVNLFPKNELQSDKELISSNQVSLKNVQTISSTSTPTTKTKLCRNEPQKIPNHHYSKNQHDCNEKSSTIEIATPDKSLLHDFLRLRSMTSYRDEHLLLGKNLNKTLESYPTSPSSTISVRNTNHDLRTIQLQEHNSDRMISEVLKNRNQENRLSTTSRNYSESNTSTPIRKQYQNNRSQGLSMTSSSNNSWNISGNDSINRLKTNEKNHNYSNNNNNNTNNAKRSPMTNLCLGDFIVSSPSRGKRKNNNRGESPSSTTSNDLLDAAKSLSEPVTSANRIKPKKRVVPTLINTSINTTFRNPTFHSENNILEVVKNEEISNNEKHSKDNRFTLIPEREVLKQQILEITKEFQEEKPSLLVQHRNLHKVLEKNLFKKPSSTSDKKIQRLKDINLTKVTNKLALDKLIEIHSALIDLNLTTNILTEISFLLNLFNFNNLPSDLEVEQEIEPNQIDQSDNSIDKIEPILINKFNNNSNCNGIHTIFKNLNNCIYFALGVLNKQKHILAMFNASTLKVILENDKHLQMFAKDLQAFLNEIYLYKLKLENMKSNYDHSFRIGKNFNNVFYQQENDTRHNFPSEREFAAFRKQRDSFYAILKTWEYNHLNPSWNFITELGPKIKSLVLIMDHPINMAHLAKLFTSQLIISSNFSDTPADLEISLPNIDPSKLTKLNQRLVQPSNFSTNYQFPEHQAFFRDFIIIASNFIVFAEQVKIALTAELIEMNNSSYEIVNLSSSASSKNEKDYNEYVVRPDTIATMRVLSKFLGLVMSRPFNYGVRNSLVDCRQIELRNMFQPTFDVLEILKKSITERKLIITVPWVVQYISMLDYVTLRLAYYQKFMHLLYELYMKLTFNLQAGGGISDATLENISGIDGNRSSSKTKTLDVGGHASITRNDVGNVSVKDSKFQIDAEIMEAVSVVDLERMRPTSIFILRSCLGWLFENPNISEEYYNYRQNRQYKPKLCYKKIKVDNNTEGDNDDNLKITILVPQNLSGHFKTNEKIILTEITNMSDNEYKCSLLRFPNQIMNLQTDEQTTKIRNNKINRKILSNNINKSLFDPLLENVLNVSCPFLADFRVSIMPSNLSKSVSRTGRYRYITTKITETSKGSTGGTESISNDSQTKLSEAFLHSQSLSVRKTVEFVIERVTSAVIKDFQMEILIPSKNNAIEKVQRIKSTVIRDVIKQMEEIFTEAHKAVMKHWETERITMIETRVKAALHSLLPNETLDIVRKTCTALVFKKCERKTDDWRISNLIGIDFYSKCVNTDAQKFVSNQNVDQPIISTTLEINLKYGSPSIIFEKLQFLLHFSLNRPNLVRVPAIEEMCNDLKICLEKQKLPSSACRVAGYMTVNLVQNLIQNLCDLVTNTLIGIFIDIWLCDCLKCFIKIPEENGKKTESGNIFDGIITKIFIRSLGINEKAFDSLSLLLIALVNANLVSIDFLNEQFVSLFKKDWPEQVLKLISNLLDNVRKKTSSSPSSGSLFMEMLADLSRDLEEF